MFTGVPLLSPHSPLIFFPCFPRIQLNPLPTIWTACSNIWRPGTGYYICGTCIDNANYKNGNGQSLEKGGGGNLILKWWGFSLSQRNWRFWSHLQGYCLGLCIKKYLHVRPILVSRGFHSQFLRSIPISFTPPPRHLSPPPRDRAVNPPRLQILRIDGEWVIDDDAIKKKKKRTKKMLF